MKKIEWIGVAWISPDCRFRVERIADGREDVVLFDRGKSVNAFSSVATAMAHAEHLKSKGTL